LLLRRTRLPRGVTLLAALTQYIARLVCFHSLRHNRTSHLQQTISFLLLKDFWKASFWLTSFYLPSFNVKLLYIELVKRYINKFRRSEVYFRYKLACFPSHKWPLFWAFCEISGVCFRNPGYQNAPFWNFWFLSSILKSLSF